MRGYQFATSLVAVTASLALASPAVGQSDAGSTTTDAERYQAPEIVVTARSKGETLLAVPVAVTAIDGAALQRYASSDIGKIIQQVPQLRVYEGAAGVGSSFMIRGIGTTGTDPSLSQSVGVVVDGIQINKSMVVYQGMYDLEQVEVLKGPQALFFGKNNPAGVISLRTRNPGSSFEARVTGGYEFEANERYVEAALGGPITDTLGVRFAGRFSKLRGWVKNISESRPNPDEPGVILPGANGRISPGTESYGGRLTVHFEPSDSFQSTLKVSAGVRNDNDALGTHEIVCPGKLIPVRANGMTDPNSDCKLNRVKAAADLPPLYVSQASVNPRWRSGLPYARFRFASVLWKNELDLDSLSLVANSGYVRLKTSLRGSSVNAEFASHTGGTDGSFHSYSQELRAISNFDGPLNFTLGGLFEKTKNIENYDTFLFFAGKDPVSGDYRTFESLATIRNETWSGFGQLRYDILDTVELAAGVRFTRESKHTVMANTFVHSAFANAFSPPSRVIDVRQTYENTSPEATITWRPNSDTTLYAAYKTGYKSGGTATPALLTAANTLQTLNFGPEKVKGGEIGFKARLLDRRIQFDATIYHYKYKNLQLSSYDAVNSVFRIQNAADAKQKGIEANINFQVNDRFLMRGSVGLNSLKYGTFANAACYAFQTAAQGCVNQVQDLSGKRLHRAPKFAASFGGSYEQPIGSELALAFDADASYTGSSFAGETQNPASFQKSYWFLNASIRLKKEDSAWELALLGRNLTNTNIIGFASDRAGGSAGEINAGGIRGREVALQASVSF